MKAVRKAWRRLSLADAYPVGSLERRRRNGSAKAKLAAAAENGVAPGGRLRKRRKHET